MIRAMRLALAGLAAAAFVALADSRSESHSRAGPAPAAVAQAGHSMDADGEAAESNGSAPRELPVDIAPEPLPTRCAVCNPPSRVIQGPFVRRIVPSRYAKPFDVGPYRYEPRLGDIRNVPPSRTLPGYYEGTQETLYSLPPRDRGYFVLFRW